MDWAITIAYMAGIFALFYFLFIRPQKKRQKEHDEMVSNLRVNDEIVTIGGILGTVIKIKDNTLILRGIDNVRLEILRNAVAEVTTDGNEEG
ncbi:MAG TPA: preprotein translocase subunit YajC [Clostridia bacterium]|nr:preprotein translocase subunit YajC [Clostridia bacterium]